MKKLISAVTSLCVAATMVSAVAPISSGAAETKALTIKAYNGASTTIDCSSADVTVPLAVYLSEDTANSLNSAAVAVTVKSGPDASKVQAVQVVDPSAAYFSEAQSYTTADGTAFSTDKVVLWAGALNKKGVYSSSGTYNGATSKQGMPDLGADNAYCAIGWINSGSSGYKWTGATSDAFPYMVFELKFPKGTADGDYEIGFVTKGIDSAHPENQATLLEGTDGTKYCAYNNNISLTGLTVTVGDGGTVVSTTTTTTPVQTTTTTSASTGDTTTTTPAGNGDITIDLGNYEAKPGDEVDMIVKIDPKGHYTTSFSAFMKVDSPITWDQDYLMEDTSEAYGSSIVINGKDLKFNFATLNGTDAMLADAGSTVFEIYWQVPANCPDGTYKVSFDKFEVKNDTTVYSVDILNGNIKVGNGTTQTTASATTPQVTTTTTTTPAGNGDIVIDLGNYEAKPGDEVDMIVKIDPKGHYTTSFSAFMKVDSPITWDQDYLMEDASEAYGSSIVINGKDLKFNFATLNGTDAMLADAGSTLVEIYWQVPANCPDGTYKVSFDKFEVKNDTTVYSVDILNGNIKVGDGSTTTSSATTTSSVTTTAPASTTTTTATTTTPGDVLYGDANCDGVVNVADVVVLNKWRNDNTSYPMKDQGKVNADCYDPKGGIDGSITEEDSLAIIQSIVHLVTLPTNSLAN